MFCFNFWGPKMYIKHKINIQHLRRWLTVSPVAVVLPAFTFVNMSSTFLTSFPRLLHHLHTVYLFLHFPKFAVHIRK